MSAVPKAILPSSHPISKRQDEYRSLDQIAQDLPRLLSLAIDPRLVMTADERDQVAWSTPLDNVRALHVLSWKFDKVIEDDVKDGWPSHMVAIGLDPEWLQIARDPASFVWESDHRSTLARIEIERERSPAHWRTARRRETVIQLGIDCDWAYGCELEFMQDALARGVNADTIADIVGRGKHLTAYGIQRFIGLGVYRGAEGDAQKNAINRAKHLTPDTGNSAVVEGHARFMERPLAKAVAEAFCLSVSGGAWDHAAVLVKG